MPWKHAIPPLPSPLPMIPGTFTASRWKEERYQLLMRLAGPEGMGTHQFAKVGFTWAEYIPLSRRFNFAYGVQNIVTFGKSLPYYEKSAIGLSRKDLPGISTELRGYERYAIDGSMVSMAKAEFKYAIVPYQTIRLAENAREDVAADAFWGVLK